MVYHNNFIRVLYINYSSGVRPLTNGPDIFFHTSQPLNLAGIHTLQAICNSSGNEEALRYNFFALIEYTIKIIKDGVNVVYNKETSTWECIQKYIETHFNQILSRENIAMHSCITPSHLSRLVRKRIGLGVNEYITQLRMAHSIRLLADNSLSIDDVAMKCGYVYTSYFIRVFRHYYLDSPCQYRSKKMEDYSDKELDI